MLPVALIQDPGLSAARRGGDPGLFVEELDRQLAAALSGFAGTARGRPPGLSVADLLGSALLQEIEASEVAAVWMTREFDLELKLGFARLCGDGARHYRLLADRFRVLGSDAADPLARGHSPLFRYLRGLETPSERLAAGGLARQRIARAQNAIFAGFSEAQGDRETARLFREVIDPDEADHLEFARRLLARFAVTVEDQERARRAVARTLQLSEERRAAAGGRGVAARAPG